MKETIISISQSIYFHITGRHLFYYLFCKGCKEQNLLLFFRKLPLVEVQNNFYLIETSLYYNVLVGDEGRDEGAASVLEHSPQEPPDHHIVYQPVRERIVLVRRSPFESSTRLKIRHHGNVEFKMKLKSCQR